MSQVLLVGSVIVGVLCLPSLLPLLYTYGNYEYFVGPAVAVGILAAVLVDVWRSVAAGLCVLASALGITAMVIDSRFNVYTPPATYVLWPLPAVFFAAAALLVLWPTARRRVGIRERVVLPGRPRISLSLLICAGSLIVALMGDAYSWHLSWGPALGLLFGAVVCLGLGLLAAATVSGWPAFSGALCLVAVAYGILTAERADLLADPQALPIWLAQVAFYGVAAALCFRESRRQKAGRRTQETSNNGVQTGAERR